MNASQISNLMIAIGSGFGFAYGAIRFFRPKKAIFLQIIACSCCCAFMGSLYILVGASLTNIGDRFNIGSLGMLAAQFFLLSASYGQIDGLGDDREKSLLKYRLIALAAPAAVMCSLIFCFSIQHLVLFVIYALTAYFNLKHLILPDVENGILDSIRFYNLAALLLIFFNILYIMAGDSVFGIIAAAVTAILYFILPGIAGRGVRRWYL